MRTVLLGSDFTYDINGELKHIEMNTNVGYTEENVVDVNNIFDTTQLAEFVTQNGFTKIDYIGGAVAIRNTLSNLATTMSIEFEFHQSDANSITVPFVEDTDTNLVIRSSYDTTAVIDDTYCRDKVEFMKLIQSESFGSQFAYLNEVGELVSNITTIVDNGNHPNFILKARYPSYNKQLYPKLYKVSNQSELDTVLATITDDYFVMQYHYNALKNIDGKVTKIRSLNILYPPTLESIPFGKYTDTTNQIVESNPIYDVSTYELQWGLRIGYITATNSNIDKPKLLDTDLVQMEDGTFKTGLDLQVGDIVKTIDIPNAANVDSTQETVNYKIDLEQFISGSTYSSNTVTAKQRIDISTDIVEIVFTDGSTWEDTEKSYYLVERDNEVRFIPLNELISGDIVILIDTTNTSSVGIVEKAVQSTSIVKKEFSGWLISVERRHIFLTVTNSSTENISFAAIEHNFDPCVGKYTVYQCGSSTCPISAYCNGTICRPCSL